MKFAELSRRVKGHVESNERLCSSMSSRVHSKISLIRAMRLPIGRPSGASGSILPSLCCSTT